MRSLGWASRWMFASAATAVSVDPVYSQDAKYLTEHAPERYTLVVGNTT